MSENVENPIFIENPFPQHTQSIVVNAYKNSNVVGDMFRYVKVQPLSTPTDATTSFSFTFLIDNHFVIDTNRSFVKLTGTLTTGVSLVNVFVSSSCKWTGGNSFSLCGGLAYFNMTQNPNRFNTVLKADLATAKPQEANTSFYPLRAINSLFNTDLLYTNLLSGITTLELKVTNLGTATNTATLFLAVVGNDKFYSTFQSLHAERFLQKFFKCDFVTGVNKTQSIGTFSQSVVAVIIFPVEASKSYNIEIGSSAKSICSTSLSAEECVFISELYNIPTTEKVAYFPLYNFSKNDFSGTDASNCTIRYVTDSTTAVNIAVISNAYGEYKNGALTIRSEI